MTDKWMPEAGQECEYLIRGEEQWTKCIYIGESSCNFPVIEKSNGDITEACYAKFRPIQTEADKYREEQRAKLASIIEAKVYDDIDECVEALYDAGCRILSDDERIVKPLSAEQINRLYRYWTENQAVKWLINEVQRELGVID